MFGDTEKGSAKDVSKLLTEATATALAQAPSSKKVIILDVDRQRNLSEFLKLDSTFSYQVRSCSVTDLKNQLEQLDKDFDLVLVLT